MKRFGLIGLGLVVVGMQLSSVAYAGEAKAVETEKAAEKPGTATRAIPFTGNVVAVDPMTHTFTLNGKAKERMFKVNDQTEILIDNKPVHFNSIAVGSIVRGQAVKHEDGWEAKKVSIGPKEPMPASDVKK